MIHWLFNSNANASRLEFGGFIARVLVLFCTLVFFYQLWLLAHIAWFIKFNPASTAFMQARLSNLQLENSSEKSSEKLKHTWVNYDNIAIHLKRAAIASEDAKFLEHQGFDWEGIQTAYEKNLKKGKIVAGGSTISQQLAKNLFLSTNRTPWRKAQEVVITVMLEVVLTKRRILEIYLNIIEWGNGVFGAEAAAQHYFHKSAKNLSRQQAAKLAAIIPNPRFYDDHASTRYERRKTSTIQARMHLVQVPK